MIDELELSEAHAEAIIEKAIKFEVYTDEMPDTKKDKIAAAHEIVAFAIDSWVDDDVRPDAKDKNVAKAGKQIEEIFEIAGVEIDDDNEITYNDPPELEGDGDDDDNDGDGEAFDIDSVIDGYAELTPATRIKKIKALELDPEDEDDYNQLVAIAEWEEAQDEPSSRVLNYLNELVPPDDDEDETADDAGDGEDEPESEEYTEKDLKKLDKDELKEIWEKVGLDDDDFPKRFTEAGKKRVITAILEAQEAGDDGGEMEEPWEGYDDADFDDIEEVINDDERTADEVEYILEYENAADEPRSKVVKLLEKRLAELNGDEPEEEPEEEEKPKGRRSTRKAKDDEPEEEPEEKPAKKGKTRSPNFLVKYNLGEGVVEVGVDGKYMAAGLVLDALDAGASSVTVKPS
jgi:hypothetical protein